jgi:hypothetical protein
MSLPEGTWLGCHYPPLSSRLLWLRRRPPRGREEHVVFFSAMLTCAMLFCAMRIFAEGRWRQTSKYDVGWWGDSGRGERKVLVHPAGNRTGNLSLMRRGWYYKTIASAVLSLMLEGRRIWVKGRVWTHVIIYHLATLTPFSSHPNHPSATAKIRSTYSDFKMPTFRSPDHRAMSWNGHLRTLTTIIPYPTIVGRRSGLR